MQTPFHLWCTAFYAIYITVVWVFVWEQEQTRNLNVKKQSSRNQYLIVSGKHNFVINVKWGKCWREYGHINGTFERRRSKEQIREKSNFWHFNFLMTSCHSSQRHFYLVYRTSLNRGAKGYMYQESFPGLFAANFGRYINIEISLGMFSVLGMQWPCIWCFHTSETIQWLWFIWELLCYVPIYRIKFYYRFSKCKTCSVLWNAYSQTTVLGFNL